MLDYQTAFFLIGMHFFADFLFQLPKVGSARGTIPRTLITHTAFYGLPFLLLGAQFFVLAVFIHGLQDLILDRFLKHYWLTKRARRHRLTFGLDQSLHIASLIFVNMLVGIDYTVYNSVIALFAK